MLVKDLEAALKVDLLILAISSLNYEDSSFNSFLKEKLPFNHSLFKDAVVKSKSAETCTLGYNDVYWVVWWFPELDIYVRFVGRVQQRSYFSYEKTELVMPKETVVIEYVKYSEEYDGFGGKVLKEIV